MASSIGKRTLIGFALALAVSVPVVVSAEEGGDFPLPPPRPEATAPVPHTPPLPVLRPLFSGGKEPAVDISEADAAETPTATETVSAPPVYQTACPAVLSGAVTASMLEPIEDGTCRVRSPLSVTAVTAGAQTIRFSAPAILTCQMAGQLATWLTRIDAYAETVFDAPVAELLVGTSYECRARNHEDGEKLSEHGFANALDVIGFRLADGTLLSLPGDWADKGEKARAMRYAHDAACGLFTTVLGPEANALHADHLHVDLGCHGRTCTYRLCQ